MRQDRGLTDLIRMLQLFKKTREGRYLLHVELHNRFLRKAECTQAAYVKSYVQSCEGLHCFLFHLVLQALSSVIHYNCYKAPTYLLLCAPVFQ